MFPIRLRVPGLNQGYYLKRIGFPHCPAFLIFSELDLREPSGSRYRWLYLKMMTVDRKGVATKPVTLDA